MRKSRGAGDTVYIDTSLWCAYCFNQSEDLAALAWLESVDLSKVATSGWAITEFASALGIQVRSKGLSQAQASAAQHLFLDLLAMANRLGVIDADFEHAAQLCGQWDGKLRGGDALHLAVAQRHGCNALASLDVGMKAQAAALGMKLVEWT